jgi:peptidase C25-like protein/beta-propeller uncharacterized protein DUF5122/uncharacterized protein DUF1573
VQADGKIILGGDFSMVNSTERNSIARLNPDGTLDTVFFPGAEGEVRAVAVQAEGKVIIGGGFISVNGVTRNRIARFVNDIISFAADDSTTKTFTLPIVDDALIEGDETLTLTLTNLTGGATLGAHPVDVLTINDNEITPEINVKGNAVSIADGDTTPSTTDGTDFGSTAVTGGMVTHSFTIENTGLAALNVSGITSTNLSEFTVGALTPASPIPPGNSATFTVTFDPSAAGLRTATVNIANDDINENPYDFAIQGTGCTPGAWIGATSSDWNTAANWSCNAVPPSGADVTLPDTGVTNEAVISNSDVTVNNLTLGASRTLKVTANHTLTVNGLLSMSNGNITVDPGSTLIIGVTGNISRTTGYVIGAVKKLVDGGSLPRPGKTASPAGTPSFTFAVGTLNGYSPVVANFTGTGDLTIKANQGPQPDQNPAKALQRYWTLAGTGITADLTFNYLQGDVMGNEAIYQLFRVSGGLTQRFPHNPPSVVIDTTNNTAFISGVSTFSDWTLGEPSAPTAVDLASFQATGYDGGVFVEWQTGNEVSNLGFNLYREQAGRRTLINSDIIAGSALKVGTSVAVRAGYSYGWWDKLDQSSGKIAGEAVYYLEDLDLNGRSTLHGPFKVNTVGGKPPTQSHAETLSHLTGGRVFTGPVLLDTQSGRGAGAVSPALFDWPGKAAMKLTIKSEGWYRVTQRELAAGGFDTRINPHNLQLFVNGVEQPMLVVGEGDNSFDATDALEFYATGQNTLSTDAHIYWLAAGSQPGKRISLLKTTGKAGGGTSFLTTIERRPRSIYFSGLLNGEAENFFGSVITSRSVEQPITLSQVEQNAPGGAELEIALQGVTDLLGNADHIVSVALNGVIIGRVVFDGRAHKVERFSIYQTNLREGDNQITLMSEGGASDIALVDYIRVSYWHRYTADKDGLRLTANSNNGATQTIDGFTSPLVRVFDITDAAGVSEIAGLIGEQKGAGYAVTVAVTGPNRTLLAVSEAQIKRPAAITLNQISNLRNPVQGADLLLITRREFFTSLAPLVSLRQRQGLSVTLVDVEDIYDEFNFGEKTPQAVKAFLAYTQSRWKKKPRFVLLGGDACYDAKNYLGFGDFDLVPTRLIDTQLMEAASDDWLVDFNDDGVAELAIGRLPVRNTAEATSMVAKLISYDQKPSAESVLLVADSNEGYDFEAASQQLKTLIPANLRIELINRGRLDAATAKAQLLEAINRGERLINYTGHGSVSLWRGNLLTNEDVRGLTNKAQLPVFVMMTCLNGYFDDPALDSLGEALLKAEGGGAVAVWASSGMTLPDGQAVMNQQMVRLLFQGGGNQLIGEVTRRAKQAITDSDIRRTWILLGDPTMKLK